MANFAVHPNMNRLFPLPVLLALACAGATPQPPMPPPAQSPQDHGGNPYYSRTDTTHLNVSDAEWARILPDSVYQVARHAATERAFTGKYWDFEGLGVYHCAVCGNALFRSDSKFGSSCGWPSFYQALRPNSVRYEEDRSFGMVRTEVLCGRCDSHLGHIFDDGPPPTGKRFCMNSIVLDFVPDEAEK
jgi:methionine-R-sulfoxide reductase